MSHSEHIAKHIHNAHFGGNWTDVNLRDTLEDVTWEQATHKIEGYNTIAALSFHIHYFVEAQLKVLEGGPLDAHDKFSFDVPDIASQEAWNDMRDTMWANVERFVSLVKNLPDSTIWETFVDPKYGTYYSNLQGLIEHTHYHLGQIVIVKKILRSSEL